MQVMAHTRLRRKPAKTSILKPVATYSSPGCKVPRWVVALSGLVRTFAALTIPREATGHGDAGANFRDLPGHMDYLGMWMISLSRLPTFTAFAARWTVAKRLRRPRIVAASSRCLFNDEESKIPFRQHQVVIPPHCRAAETYVRDR